MTRKQTVIYWLCVSVVIAMIIYGFAQLGDGPAPTFQSID